MSIQPKPLIYTVLTLGLLIPSHAHSGCGNSTMKISDSTVVSDNTGHIVVGGSRRQSAQNKLHPLLSPRNDYIYKFLKKLTVTINAGEDSRDALERRLIALFNGELSHVTMQLKEKPRDEIYKFHNTQMTEALTQLCEVRLAYEAIRALQRKLHNEYLKMMKAKEEKAVDTQHLIIRMQQGEMGFFEE